MRELGLGEENDSLAATLATEGKAKLLSQTALKNRS
jgi:hypothetical protein